MDAQLKNTLIDKPIVWVLGGPGSGKGTQCDKIIAKYGFTHLSSGDLLRAEVKSGSVRGKNLAAIMERGELVPNEIVLELLKEAIEAKIAESNGFLIDGYPREKSQGEAFEEAIAPCTVIIYFEATAETLTKRLLGRAASSGRADDNEDTIKLRLKTFVENNELVLAQYPDKLKRPPVEKPIVWVLGGPGVGKGTQCDKIVAKYGFTHLSTGDLLRDEVSSGSERGKMLADVMARGGLVSNDVVLELLKDAIEKHKATSKGFLIDGYPREKSQGEAFEKAIAPCNTILYFEASTDTMKKRLLGRAAASKAVRADDNEQAIQIRLKTFLDNNAQVLAQFPNKFKAINAERPVGDVFHDVENVLDRIVSLQRA